MYFDFVFAKTLKYTVIRPIKRKMLMQTAITPRVGRKTSPKVSGVTRISGKPGGTYPPNSLLKCVVRSFVLQETLKFAVVLENHILEIVLVPPAAFDQRLLALHG